MNTDKPKKKTVFLILAIVLFVAGACAIAYAVITNMKARNEQKMYEDLAAQTTVGAPIDESQVIDSEDNNEPENDGENQQGDEEEIPEPVDLSIYDIPEKQIDFDALRTDTNEDIYAWITIPDTQIDYPIVQHPTELDYYLDHNLDGSTGYPGCIYSQFLNATDFSDFNTVIYGHNMNNGSMFANLHYYEDVEFFNNHPYVYVYTPEGPLVYQVFASYEYSNIHILMGFDFTSEETRGIYLNTIFQSDGFRDHVNTEVEVGTDSNIITLETCIGTKPEKRYVLGAVLVADGRNQ